MGVVCCLFDVVRCALFWCLLFVACCSLVVVCVVLFVVRCLLGVACLMAVVRR